MIDYLIVSSILASFLALLLASFLSFKLGDKNRKAIDLILTSIAIGTLITTAFAGTFFQIVKDYPRPHTNLFVMAGAIVVFCLLEQILPLRKVSQQDGCENHPQLSGPKFFLGNTVYHIFMGLVLAAGYIKSSSVGICTATAIFVYQLVHEKGVLDVSLLQEVQKKKALIQNLLFNVLLFIFAISGYYILLTLEMVIVDLILSASVGVFIYLSVSDMVSKLHEKRNPKLIIVQFVIIILSMLLMALLIHLNSFFSDYTSSINWVDLG